MSFAVSNEEVQALFDKELQKANKNNPQYHSAHEGYAVLLEEVEEASAELGHLEFRTESIWDIIKNDDGHLKANIEEAKMFASSLVQEAIQVGAMCDKFLDYLEKR